MADDCWLKVYVAKADSAEFWDRAQKWSHEMHDDRTKADNLVLEFPNAKEALSEELTALAGGKLRFVGHHSAGAYYGASCFYSNGDGELYAFETGWPLPGGCVLHLDDNNRIAPKDVSYAQSSMIVWDEMMAELMR